MPFINVNTNVEISEKERIKIALGQLIEIIPNKDESKTMICINEKKDMYFRGSDEPCAMVETFVNLGTDPSKNTEYTLAIIDMIAHELNIPVNRVYATIDVKDFWMAKRG